MKFGMIIDNSLANTHTKFHYNRFLRSEDTSDPRGGVKPKIRRRRRGRAGPRPSRADAASHSYILTPEHNGPSADEVAHPDLTAIKEKNDYAQGILLILSPINFAGDFDIGPGCLAALHH